LHSAVQSTLFLRLFPHGGWGLGIRNYDLGRVFSRKSGSAATIKFGLHRPDPENLAQGCVVKVVAQKSPPLPPCSRVSSGYGLLYFTHR
jgi:hypothetical protein